MQETKPFNISKKVVFAAFERVKANKGTYGVDEQSLADFEKDLKNNLYKVWNRMSSGSYFPKPVKAVAIPKKNGGTRILGIPTVEDRVAQMTAKMYFEPCVEKIFHEDSYGYRPGKSMKQALAATRERCWRKDWVLEFDIKGLFDHIRHDYLMKLVKKHAKENWGNPVYREMVKSTVPDGRWRNSRTNVRHTARWSHQSSIGELISALCFRRLHGQRVSQHPVGEIRR